MTGGNNMRLIEQGINYVCYEKQIAKSEEEKRFVLNKGFDTLNVLDMTKFDEQIYVNKSSKDMGLLVDLLNHLHEENQIKLEIVDAFIRGMEDEKGIDPENKEFQCRMNHTIRVLKRLKEDMINPTEFKRLKELKK